MTPRQSAVTLFGEPAPGELRPSGVEAPRWDRFDICEAWYLFAVDWHEGQGSATYAILGRLERLGFRPSPVLSRQTLSPNGRRILAGLQSGGL